jgi:hypothetical protein
MSDYSKTRIQLRRGTSAEWNTSSTDGNKLGVGEPGYDSSSGVLKVGDGSKTWNALGAQIKSDPTGIPGASGITNIVFMTQAAYDALSSYSNQTIYYIV